MQQRYYAHDPETPLSNKLLCILLGIVIIFLLAYVHGIVISINPVIYLSFVITIGFGFIFGILYRVISKIAKVRDSKFVIISGLAIMLLGMYFSWGAYLLMLSGELEYYFPSLGLLLSPVWVFGSIGDLYTYGSWSLFGGAVVNGIFLGLIWIGELIMVLYMTFHVLRAYEIAPFSQRFNKWFIKYKLHDEYQSLADADMFFEKEGNTLTEKVKNLGRGHSTRYGRISIFYLENAGEAYFLYENVGRDSKGKKETGTAVIDHLAIPNTEAAQLIKTYYGKKEFYFEY
ncbi:hypothetical protein POV27_06635 [Aureisphaera galaxeae]|uniref:hypothetical protein n=1 Tax=Aureisphaera galaxeae TaxID=1538023 RepID=UPI0023504F75|nr:hypothetical protein [Aureisphaera galaxeae]MDC8003720.1 hypothetical protein [Aureisphaera galaxeae]